MTDLIHILLEMRSGQVAADLNAKFNECLQAVLDTGGKGKVQITLNVSASKFAMGGVVVEVEMSHDTKLTKPELKVGKAIFFVDRTGKLSRHDPNQTDMFDAAEVQKEER